MFQLNDIFAQAFPWLEGISWDLGTILTALVFLWCLILGFDFVKAMLLGNWERDQYNKASLKYFAAAEELKEERNLYEPGSSRWLEADMTYKKMLGKSSDARVKGYRY